MQSREDLVAKAAAAMETGEFQDAVSLYEQIVEQEPANAEMWYRLGRARRRINQLYEAEEAYAKALELKPDEISYHMARGANLAHRSTLWEDALKSYEQVLRLVPDNIEARIRIADVKRHQGKLEEARKALESLKVPDALQNLWREVLKKTYLDLMVRNWVDIPRTKSKTGVEVFTQRFVPEHPLDLKEAREWLSQAEELGETGSYADKAVRRVRELVENLDKVRFAGSGFVLFMGVALWALFMFAFWWNQMGFFEYFGRYVGYSLWFLGGSVLYYIGSRAHILTGRKPRSGLFRILTAGAFDINTYHYRVKWSDGSVTHESDTEIGGGLTMFAIRAIAAIWMGILVPFLGLINLLRNRRRARKRKKKRNSS